MSNSVKPLVTVICLCYNHEKYVLESLYSVKNQTYTNIELIIVDDASTDESLSFIESFSSDYSVSHLLSLDTNLGHCHAFNLALKKAKGKYIIDLAADDILLPERIERQVHFFESLTKNYGVIFSDTYLINEKGNKKWTYYPRDKQGNILTQVPSGDIYIHLIKKFFFSPITIMIRKSVLDEIGGYDESLSYEDYDFLVRSSRNYNYAFQNEILSIKRILSSSQYTKIYNVGKNRHLQDTLTVCYKAYQLNQNSKENKALLFSVRYHLRVATFTCNFQIASGYFALLKCLKKPNLLDKITFLIIRYQINLNFFYKKYINFITQVR